MRYALLLSLLFYSGQAAASPLYHSTTPCDVNTEHKANDDVAYQSGVTAGGEAIAPADLNAMPGQEEPEVNVYLDVPLSEHIAPGSRAQELTQSYMGVGQIHVKGQDAEADILGQRYETGRDNDYVAGCD